MPLSQRAASRSFGSHKSTQESPQESGRPAGVWVIAALELIVGVVILGVGLWSVGLSIFSPSYSNTGGLGSLATFFSVFLIIYGAVMASSAYGLWAGLHWGWIWSLFLTAVGMALLIVVPLLFLRPGPPYYAQTFLPVIGLVLGLSVLWYLLEASVRGWIAKDG